MCDHIGEIIFGSEWPENREHAGCDLLDGQIIFVLFAKQITLILGKKKAKRLRCAVDVRRVQWKPLSRIQKIEVRRRSQEVE